MGITYGDWLIDSGYYDITPEQEREIEERHDYEKTLAALEWAADAIYQQDGGAPGTISGWKSDEAMAHWFTIRRMIKQASGSTPPPEKYPSSDWPAF